MNNQVVFPFSEVKRGARVVLYGLGYTGQAFLQQCLHTNWCEVLFAVDQCPINISLHEVPCYYPSALPGVSEDTYDKIIVATLQKKLADEIISYLLSINISPDKIIWKDPVVKKVHDLRSPELQKWYQPSFSWYGEDLIVRNMFFALGILKPSYLDIGSNHPYMGNNTACLYLSGSRGVNIDASQACISLMNEERPDDINVCVGVAAERGDYTFHVVNDETNGANTFCTKYLQDLYACFGTQDIPILSEDKMECLTLAEIIEKYCEGIFPDYFDLDIEGWDEAVVNSYDFSKMGPIIMTVESRSEDMYVKLLRDGYAKYIHTPHNTIFVRNDYLDKLLMGNR